MSLISAADATNAGTGDSSIELPDLNKPMSKFKLLRIEFDSGKWPVTTRLSGGPSLTRLRDDLSKNTAKAANRLRVDQVDDTPKALANQSQATPSDLGAKLALGAWDDPTQSPGPSHTNSRRKPSKVNLANLPNELLAKICAHLDSFWILNLSHTSRALHENLNGRGANWIWYNALPKALYAKHEQFQSEAELYHWKTNFCVSPFVSPFLSPRLWYDPLTNRIKNSHIDALPFDEASHIPPQTAAALKWNHMYNGARYQFAQIANPSYGGRYYGSANNHGPAYIAGDLSAGRNAPAPLMLNAIGPRGYTLTADGMVTVTGALALPSAPQYSLMPTSGLDTTSSLVSSLWQSTPLPSGPLPANYRSFGALSPYPPVNLSTKIERSLYDNLVSQDGTDLRLSKRQRIGASPVPIGQRIFPPSSTTEWFTPRDRVKILGGPFVPNFNYKREIVGRMAQKVKKRCFLCLDMEHFFKKQGVTNKHWGIQWCSSCLGEYTISLTFMEKVLDDLKIAFPEIRKVKYPYAGHQRLCFSRRTIRLYKPEVDVWFASLGLYSTDIAVRINERKKLLRSLLPDGRCREHLNDYRKNLRWQLVKSAELIWDGTDPAPNEVLSADGRVVNVSRSHINRQRFAMFRERFAPTRKLRQFLYPPHALPDTVPRAHPWAFVKGMFLGKNYPNDPYEKFTTRQVAPTAKMVSDAAEEILVQLTSCFDGRYCSYGWGGVNTIWIQAAEQYHARRLICGLILGVTISAFPPTFIKRDRIHESWRTKLGFTQMAPEVDQGNIHKAVKRVSLTEVLGHEATEELIAVETRRMEAEYDRKRKIEAFAKIAITCCKRCPMSSQLLHEKGISGLISHVRQCHRGIFFASDVWNITG